MDEISIAEICGFKIGQAQNFEAATGCTVIICEEGAVCGVDVRGGSPGTRDTDALNPVNNREKVHAVMLSGGSSFGLDAAGGVMSFLEEKQIGRNVAVTVVPNVCAAILFDLKCGSADVRPDIAMGRAACEDAFSQQVWKSGNYGAGTGATLGTIGGIDLAMKGGIGSSAFRQGDLYVGAVIAVNCIGDIYDNKSGVIIAGARTADGKAFADTEKLVLDQYKDTADFYSGDTDSDNTCGGNTDSNNTCSGIADSGNTCGGNTVIGCILTNADLTKAQATKLAALGQNGIARTVRPAHTVYDGDTIFTMCTGEVSANLDAVGILACKAVEIAIIDAVKSAASFDIYPSAVDFNKGFPGLNKNAPVSATVFRP